MQNIRLHFIVDMDEASSNFSPSLGIGYLSAYLKKHLEGIQVSLSFLSDNIASDIERIKPDIIGFSSTSRFFTECKEIGRQIKTSFSIPIIWGGVHISIAPHELPEFVDVGVLGEGEETLTELLSNFEHGHFKNLGSVRGIAYRQNGELVFNEKRPFIEPLDTIPYPDLDLLRVKWNRLHRGVMMTSRGCPFKCRFCASSKFWDRTRLHSPEYVVNEMRNLVDKYGVNEILFYDDFFTIDKKRIAKIAELKKSDPKVKKLKIECLSRVDNFDEFLAGKLKEMGVCRIAFGIESGCQKTLDYLKNKTLKLEQVERAIKIANAYGLECMGSFIIGSPFETIEDIEETLSFIEKLKLKEVQITVATPFPGTQLWEDGKQLGKIDGDEWSDDYYVLYGYDPKVDPVENLRGKKLVTQLEEAVFFSLIKKSAKLLKKKNYSIRQIVYRKFKNLLKKIRYRFSS